MTSAVLCCVPPSRHSTTTPPESQPTRYREGDWVVYRYVGASSEPPVEMTERVIAQNGTQLEIEVVLRRGDEERQWIQVLTDTPENQQNNVIDALYEVVDGERRRLANEENRDVFRLYSWIFAPIDDQTTPEEEESVEIDFAGQRHHCLRRTTLGASSGRSARMITHTCRTFLWTHGPGSLIDLETEETLWNVTVEAAGNTSGARLTRPSTFRDAIAEEIGYLELLVHLWWAAQEIHEQQDGVQLESIFDRLEQQTRASGDIAEYAQALREGLCRLGDGHLRLQRDWRVPQRTLASGLSFELVEEGIALASIDATRLPSDSVTPQRGDLVVAVDGDPVDTYISQTCMQPGSTPLHRRSNAVEQLSRQRLYQHESARPVELTLRRPDDRTYDLSLQWEGVGGSQNDPVCVSGSIMDSEREIGVLRVDGFWCNDASFRRQLLDSARVVQRARHLIIDLRRNGGGSDVQARLAASLFIEERTEWMRFSHRRPYGENRGFFTEDLEPDDLSVPIHLSPQLTVLIGPGCFSTCEIFASVLQASTDAVFLGEPTAGGVGNPTSFRLPYSSLVVQIPVTLYSLPGQENELIEGRGVHPQIDVIATANDVRTDRDPVMERAIERIMATTEPDE